jgi:hypothetical protein
MNFVATPSLLDMRSSWRILTFQVIEPADHGLNATSQKVAPIKFAIVFVCRGTMKIALAGVLIAYAPGTKMREGETAKVIFELLPATRMSEVPTASLFTTRTVSARTARIHPVTSRILIVVC